MQANDMIRIRHGARPISQCSNSLSNSFVWALGVCLPLSPSLPACERSRPSSSCSRALLAPNCAHAQGAAEPCRAALAAAERAAFVPDRLMQAIGIMESGRRLPSGVTAPWPWTINVEGVGEVFDTKQQAIAAVTAHRARGARSIDVGCMQVNLMHHATAFASLDDAFDPVINARYAAQFLQRLLAQTGSWPRAVAGYHSLTPDIGGEYARKVLAIWARPEPRPDARPPQPQGPTLAQAAPSGPGPALPAPARMLAMPGSAMPVMTGRSLDSYRAIPTSLSAGPLFRRF